MHFKHIQRVCICVCVCVNFCKCKSLNYSARSTCQSCQTHASFICIKLNANVTRICVVAQTSFWLFREGTTVRKISCSCIPCELGFVSKYLTCNITFLLHSIQYSFFSCIFLVRFHLSSLYIYNIIYI